MRTTRAQPIETIDWHTGGEPFRIVVDGPAKVTGDVPAYVHAHSVEHRAHGRHMPVHRRSARRVPARIRAEMTELLHAERDFALGPVAAVRAVRRPAHHEGRPARRPSDGRQDHRGGMWEDLVVAVAAYQAGRGAPAGSTGGAPPVSVPCEIVLSPHRVPDGRSTRWCETTCSSARARATTARCRQRWRNASRKGGPRRLRRCRYCPERRTRPNVARCCPRASPGSES